MKPDMQDTSRFTAIIVFVHVAGALVGSAFGLLSILLYGFIDSPAINDALGRIWVLGGAPLVAGLGGLVAARIWCTVMSRMTQESPNIDHPVLRSVAGGSLLGLAVGAVDGILPHIVILLSIPEEQGWGLVVGLGFGLGVGLVMGLVFGLWWGLLWSWWQATRLPAS